MLRRVLGNRGVGTPHYGSNQENFSRPGSNQSGSHYANSPADSADFLGSQMSSTQAFVMAQNQINHHHETAFSHPGNQSDGYKSQVDDDDETCSQFSFRSQGFTEY